MSEAEVTGQLIQFTGIVLTGAGVLFTVVSAYLAALRYVIGRASWSTRLGAFAFMSFVVLVLLVVLWGASRLHEGLIARLATLHRAHLLTEAGEVALANSTATVVRLSGVSLGLDAVLSYGLWMAMGLTYGVLVYLTFIHRWRD